MAYYVKGLENNAYVPVLDTLWWADAVSKAKRTNGGVVLDAKGNVLWTRRGKHA